VDAGAAPRSPAAPLQRFALTTAGGYFFVGEESAVRQALQVQATPDRAARFYAGPLFQRLQRSVPKGAVSYEITDCARAVRALLTKLTAEQGILPALLAQCSSGLNLPATTADISKLPPASHIASFFGPLLSTAELRDGRIVAHLEGVYPAGR
jgi:hypothetical protein